MTACRSASIWCWTGSGRDRCHDQPRGSSSPAEARSEGDSVGRPVQVTLAGVTTHSLEHGSLVFGLDALRGDAEAQAVAELDDGIDDGVVVGGMARASDTNDRSILMP